MKRLLFFLSLLLLFHQLSAQRYTPMPTWYEFYQVKFRDHLQVPILKKTTSDSALLAYGDRMLWLKTDTGWTAVGAPDASKVPLTRTITINGTSYDLTIDRSWTLTKSDIDLDNVDNTSDLDKPVSTAQQAALDLKVDSVKRRTDSVFFYTNGVEIFAFKDSTGGGSQNLQQTTDIGAVTTNTITAGDINYDGVPNYSEKRSAASLFRYRDSTGFNVAPIRSAVDAGTGAITWKVLSDVTHEPVGYSGASANVNGQLEITYPTNTKIHSSSIVIDETLAALVGGVGASVGTDKSIVYLYRQATWGGQLAWVTAQTNFINSGVVYNGAGTITYSADSGLVRIVVNSYQDTGPIRDYKRISVSINRSDFDVSYRSDLSSDKVLCFQVTDKLGDIPPTSAFTNTTYINFVASTYPLQVPLNSISSSNAWLQKFITNSANFFATQIFKLLP